MYEILFIRGFEEINPEILGILNTINNNKIFDENEDAFARTEAAVIGSRKIALSDQNLGDNDKDS